MLLCNGAGNAPTGVWTHILLFVLLKTAVHAQPVHVIFEHHTVEDGLAMGVVQAILQDRRGFMWFGTQDGLNRYDGYDFKIYKQDPRNPHSISSDLIMSIGEDRNGNLWIGTQAGLNRFDPLRQQFTRVNISNTQLPAIEKGGVYSIFEDSEGYIWVRTRTGRNIQRPPGSRCFLPLAWVSACCSGP